MDLVIVESPTKARTLGGFLPDSDYVVEATVGHVRDLPKSKLGVDVENDFLPDWEAMKGKQEVMRKLIQKGQKADRILLATDPDREGEAIAWHVHTLMEENKKFDLKKKQVLRITFHEITKEAILDAIDHAGALNKELFDAQQARRVVDRLVGYKLSPVLWKKVRRGLSAGRVQSVAVRLVVEREREREAFEREEYWEIVAELSSFKEQKKNFNLEISKPRNLETFYAWLKTVNGKQAEIGDEKLATEIMGNLDSADYVVKSVGKKEVKQRPSPPFTTSTLQQTAGQRMGWSAKRTMRVAQSLYEQGLITYHRTDSTNLADKAVKLLRSFVKSEYGENYLPEKPVFYKTKSKVAQEAHEAIRPTEVSVMAKIQSLKFKIDGDQERLYRLIWQRFVACQMAEAVYDMTRIEVEGVCRGRVSAPNEGRGDPALTYGLHTEGKVRKFDGWMKVYGKEAHDDDLPELLADQALQLIEVSGGQRFTEPPARYSEATLIKKLEELGIGRPSTYAPTMATIQDRGYVERVEGRLIPSAVGMATNDFLVKNFPNELEYQFTVKMEDQLDCIARGECDWVPVVRDFYEPFMKSVEKAESGERMKVPTESTGEKCPDCISTGSAQVGEVVIRTGKFGKFLSCSRFPECKFTAKFLDKIGVVCPDCGEGHNGEVIVKKSKRGRQFFGCSRYPECKWVSWNDPRKGNKKD